MKTFNIIFHNIHLDEQTWQKKKTYIHIHIQHIIQMYCGWQRNSYSLEKYLKQLHQSVYISVLASATAHVKTSSVKPFVAPEEDAWHLKKLPTVMWLPHCIVGNAGARFWKGRRMHGIHKGNKYFQISLISWFSVMGNHVPMFNTWHLHFQHYYQITCNFLCSHERLYTAFSPLHS